MALIDLKSVVSQALARLDKLAPPGGIEILSYKRNRGLTVLKDEDGPFFVRERGYQDDEFRVTGEGLARLLKSICKREFPRSRKVRIYQLAGPREADLVRKKL